jgi:hypothetical protein
MLTDRLKLFLDPPVVVVEPPPVPGRDKVLQAWRALSRLKRDRAAAMASLERACRFEGNLELVACLRRQPEALRMASSLVLRFNALDADLAALRREAESEAPDLVLVERIKGRHAGLLRLNLYFRAYPALHGLFNSGACA